MKLFTKLLFTLLLICQNAHAGDNVKFSDFSNCQNDADIPICLLKIVFKDDENPFILDIISNNPELLAKIFPPDYLVTKIQKQEDELPDDLKDFAILKEALKTSLTLDSLRKDPKIAIEPITKVGKKIKAQPLPFLGYSMPNGAQLRAMAYEKIADTYLDEETVYKPSLGLVKAALLEWEKDFNNIEENYLSPFPQPDNLILYYERLKDYDALKRIAKNHMEKAIRIKVGMFKQANNDMNIPVIIEMSKINLEDEDSEYYNLTEEKWRALEILSKNGEKQEAIRIAKSLLNTKRQAYDAPKAIKYLAKLLDNQEFAKLLRPYETFALYPQKKQSEIYLPFEIKNYDISSTTYSDEKARIGAVVAISGNYEIGNKKIIEEILKNWEPYALEIPSYIANSFETNSIDFKPDFYHELLNQAGEEIRGIDKFSMKPSRALYWDIANGRGISKIDEITKAAKSPTQMETAFYNCVELQAYENNEIAAECVRRFSKIASKRPLNETELERVKEPEFASFFHTSSIALTKEALKVAEYAGNKKDYKLMTEMLNIAFEAAKNTPDVQFSGISSRTSMSYIAINILKSQNRL